MSYQAHSVLDEVAKERFRQLGHYNYTPTIDDTYADWELLRASASYIQASMGAPGAFQLRAGAYWPWKNDSFKPTEPRRNLIKAAALLVAEIERLDRLEAKGEGR